MGTPPPPLSPTVATPLAHRKRRHSEINGIRPESGKATATQQLKNGRPQSPNQTRLQVPPMRGRSATPVKRERPATPSSSLKSPGKTNGTSSPRPNGAARLTASPRPSALHRPVASPRPNVTSRPSASPRPSLTSRPSASPRSGASPQPQVRTQRRVDSSDDSSSDGESNVGQSDIEDILDTAEMEPFTLAIAEEGFVVLDSDSIATLKQRLRDVGPQKFLVETLHEANMPPEVLGTAFGLDPRLSASAGPELFLHILQEAVVRCYRKRQKLPQYNTLDDVAELLKKSSKIMIIAGAGISTSLGIPDFRSKGSGFYDTARAKLAKYEHLVDEPEQVFDIEVFDEEPQVFFDLAGDILPDEKKFSPTHAFIKLLQDKGKLLTCYTQNIDNLEESAGLSKEKLIQCHGSFATATCRRKGVKNPEHKVNGSEIFAQIRAGEIAYCKVCDKDIEVKKAEKRLQDQRKKRFKLTPSKRTPTPSFGDDDEGEDDSLVRGVMKPDITFFGEQLPSTFFDRFHERDTKVVDLVLVLGTSLKVAPVSEMPGALPHNVPHVYVSREAIKHIEFDVQCLGDCDDVVVELCRRAGWSGADGRSVVEHEMVEAQDREGRTIVVEAWDEDHEGCMWRVRREE